VNDERWAWIPDLNQSLIFIHEPDRRRLVVSRDDGILDYISTRAQTFGGKVRLARKWCRLNPDWEQLKLFHDD
jgi:hypothetical protein